MNKCGSLGILVNVWCPGALGHYETLGQVTVQIDGFVLKWPATTTYQDYDNHSLCAGFVDSDIDSHCVDNHG